MLDLSIVSCIISKLCVLIIMAMIDVDASQSKWSTVEETIACYECKSTADRDCRDPFNSSLGLFPLEPCKGCCIKIIQHRSTGKYEQESIWRTCTAKLDISHSLVHSDVCMDESNGRGQLCICSSDKCNPATSLIHSTCAFLLPFLPAIVMFHRPRL